MMFVPVPTIPLVEVISTPGTFPLNKRAMSASGLASSCSPPTEVTA